MNDWHIPAQPARPGEVSAEPASPERGPDQRRPYLTPRLIKHGDLRDITLGGSAGMGESGLSATHAFN